MGDKPLTHEQRLALIKAPIRITFVGGSGGRPGWAGALTTPHDTDIEIVKRHGRTYRTRRGQKEDV